MEETVSLAPSQLLQIGARRLALLGKHHQLLMQGYLQGAIDETALSEQAIKKLLAARIIWRPSEEQPLTLRPLVSELIASMVADEHRRQINADVAEKLEQIRNRVQAYQESQFRGDYAAGELQLQRLTEHVHDLSGQFEEAIDSLWHRLNSDFGFVASLADKIRENQRAQQQLRRLLDGLGLIDFAELIELSEGNNNLRKLLVSQLQPHLSAHHASLLAVQQRLIELLARFRQQQARSLLITNMAAFLREHPNYKPLNYPSRSEVPDKFNRAQPLIPAAAIALDASANYEVLTSIARALPRIKHEPTPEPQAGDMTVNVVDEAVMIRQQALKADVENFYLSVIESGVAMSALDYLAHQPLAWDGEIWLYQIVAEYQALPAQVQSRLSLTIHEEKASPQNELRLIEDIEVCTHG